MGRPSNTHEIKISDAVKIIIQRKTFSKKAYVDIRKWVKTKKYTGYTRKGIMIPTEFWPKFLEVIQKVKI